MRQSGSFFGPKGLRLMIDVNDPDTPAMVYLKKESATYGCAVDTGEVGCEELTQHQLHWLGQFEDRVGAAFEKARTPEWLKANGHT